MKFSVSSSETIIVAAIVIVTGMSMITGIRLYGKMDDSKEEAAPLFEPKSDTSETVSGTVDLDFEAGVGWGSGDTQSAVLKALDMALKGKKQKKPDMIILHPTAGSDSRAILKEIRTITGGRTKIFGGTSDARGVLAGRHYVKGAVRGYQEALTDIEKGSQNLALMTISTPLIDFGVGQASLENHESKKETARQALKRAIQNAGKNKTLKPSVILMSPTIGMENDAIEMLELEGFGAVPLVGGSAAGPGPLTICQDRAVDKGIGFALFYTDLPVGWAFEGGYDVLDKYSGVVTKTDGRRIVEIDGRPAFKVYDRWMDGRVSAFLENKLQQSRFRDFLSLHPLARIRRAPDGKTYTILSHPWAPNKDLITNGLNTTTNIREGDRVFLSYGTWEILLNRIGNLPAKAKTIGSFDETTPVLMGLAYFCAGVLGTIPDNNREVIPSLISHALGNAPYIGSITWGEQGQLPGIGNQHCNLTIGLLLIGGRNK